MTPQGGYTFKSITYRIKQHISLVGCGQELNDHTKTLIKIVETPRKALIYRIRYLIFPPGWWNVKWSDSRITKNGMVTPQEGYTFNSIIYRIKHQVCLPVRSSVKWSHNNITKGVILNMKKQSTSFCNESTEFCGLVTVYSPIFFDFHAYLPITKYK